MRLKEPMNLSQIVGLVRIYHCRWKIPLGRGASDDRHTWRHTLFPCSFGDMRLRSALILFLTGMAPIVLRAQEPSEPTSVLDSVFTAEQADRGDRTFMRVCIDCHLPEEFSDAGYLYSWEGQLVADLMDYMQTNMPEDNPGTLKNTEYLDVIAYILELNGIPSGSRTLNIYLANSARIELP